MGFFVASGLYTYSVQNQSGVVLGTPYTLNLNTIASTNFGGLWGRNGTVINGVSSSQYSAQEPSVILDSNPQLITGSSFNLFFKMWFTCGWTVEAVCYTESEDGFNWQTPITVIAVGNPASHGHEFKFGSTYYAYEGNSPTSSTAFSQYTSTDGVNWTLAHANVIVQGTGGDWDSGALGNIFVFPNAVGTTWYAMYEARTGSGPYILGVATSPDGVTWTKYSGSPVLTGPNGNGAGGPEVHLVNGTFYVWYQAGTNIGDAAASDIYRASSTDFLHWTPNNNGAPVFTRQTSDEGLNSTGGQVADPSMLQIGNSVYMFYDALANQDFPSENGNQIHLKVAVAPMTFAQLVTTNEGNGSPLHNNGTFNELHLQDCVNWNNGFQNAVPCQNNTGRFDIGTMTFGGAGVGPHQCFNCYFDGSLFRYVTNGLAFQESLNTGTGLFQMNIGTGGATGTPVTLVPVFNFNNTGGGFTVPLSIQQVTDSNGFGKAGGNGCAITAGAIGNKCLATITLPVTVTQPDTNYFVMGCQVTNAAVGTVVGGANTLTTTTFTVEETATNTTSTGGGMIHCLIMR